MNSPELSGGQKLKKSERIIESQPIELTVTVDRYGEVRPPLGVFIPVHPARVSYISKV